MSGDVNFTLQLARWLDERDGAGAGGADCSAAGFPVAKTTSCDEYIRNVWILHLHMESIRSVRVLL